MNGRICKLCGKGGCGNILEIEAGCIKLIFYLCDSCRSGRTDNEIAESILKKGRCYEKSTEAPKKQSL